MTYHYNEISSNYMSILLDSNVIDRAQLFLTNPRTPQFTGITTEWSFFTIVHRFNLINIHAEFLSP